MLKYFTHLPYIYHYIINRLKNMSEKRLLIKLFKDPFRLFNIWFEEAVKKEINDPNAMNLSTLSKDKRPSSRIVLLKDYDESGFVFYTNSTSKKGSSIEKNPYVALNFHWKSSLRQIRIEGKAKKVSNLVSDKYFNSRPRDSRIGAWASNQSNKLANRETLIKNFNYYKKLFEKKPLVRPPHWIGYKVSPKLIEFWQQMPSRLHDRLEYKKINNKWKVRKLFP